VLGFLNFDFLDLYHGEFLSVTDGFVIAFAAFHFERDFFLAANVLDDIGQHTRAGDRRRAYSDFALVAYQQHAIKGERLAGLDRESFDFEAVASGDSILFTSGFQYSVHKIIHEKGVK
jgi:hypothetical protein